MLLNVISLLCDLRFFILSVSSIDNSFPKPLSAKAEEEAILKAEKGDGAARDLLIRHNLRLVAHIVKKFYASREDQDDLISIGTIGLIKAVSSYHPDKKIRLATYAAKCIENEILMYFRSQKKLSGEVSLSDPIDTDKDGNTLSLIDIIKCDDNMLDGIEADESKKALLRAVKEELSPREREITVLRYGLFGKEACTQQTVADIFGISRSYVSRIEKKALSKLKRRLS
ncbi:MAG: RNA polymerase sporulation sigma factor SigK [Clostridia bacterium]|nr:RNA polymerase sporulation sigma factor SigK [Clostridia bacterium]